MFFWLGWLIFFLIHIAWQIKKPKNFPPGPFWLPFVGSKPTVRKFAKKLGGQYLALSKLADDYGTNVLGLKLGADHVIAVFSYDTIKEVLTSEIFEGRPNNFFFRLRCMGERRGITSTDETVWTTQRSVAVRHLKCLGYGKPIMETMIQTEIGEILTIIKNNPDEIEIPNLMAPAVLNILWGLATGSTISRQDPLLIKLLELMGLRAKAFDMSGGVLSQHPWLRFLFPNWSGFNLIQNINSNLKELLMDNIQSHYKLWYEGREDDLIYRYITEMKAGNTMLTDDHLVMICLDLFIGGSVTTSTTLNFAFLYMIYHPEIQKRVQDEIDEKFKKEQTVTYNDRHSIPYIEAVLLEVQRLRTAAPLAGPRRALKDTILDGYFIPKNTTVLLSTYSVHHDKTLFEHPELFKPERFLDKNGAFTPSEKMIHFGLGRRRCLADVLAKSCIFLMFVEIMRWYSVEMAEDCKLPSRKPLDGITISPEKYKVRFVKRC